MVFAPWVSSKASRLQNGTGGQCTQKLQGLTSKTIFKDSTDANSKTTSFSDVDIFGLCYAVPKKKLCSESTPRIQIPNQWLTTVLLLQHTGTWIPNRLLDYCQGVVKSDDKLFPLLPNLTTGRAYAFGWIPRTKAKTTSHNVSAPWPSNQLPAPDEPGSKWATNLPQIKPLGTNKYCKLLIST